jgi:hypothetical protein
MHSSQGPHQALNSVAGRRKQGPPSPEKSQMHHQAVYFLKETKILITTQRQTATLDQNKWLVFPGDILFYFIFFSIFFI